jgi:hypothetical protein
VSALYSQEVFWLTSTGVGHSSPYEEASCYSLVVDYLFHATPARRPVPPLHIEPFSARDAKNDFELPWIMRAIVDSPEVKDLFPDELRDLKEGILHWRPTTKALKEIKRRVSNFFASSHPHPCVSSPLTKFSSNPWPEDNPACAP